MTAEDLALAIARTHSDHERLVFGERGQHSLVLIDAIYRAPLPANPSASGAIDALDHDHAQAATKRE